MPELPEVETCLRGISPHLIKQKVNKVILRHHQLRWPIPKNIATELPGQRFINIERRSKYLLFHTETKMMIIHLGMSGVLRIVDKSTPAAKHDHCDILFANKYILRLTDPRRFGALLWTHHQVDSHPLLQYLGPEPLSKEFNTNYFYNSSRNRQTCIKTFMMNSKIVVGIGNIYANEILFCAGISPMKPAGKLSKEETSKLVAATKKILAKAIQQGGTTIKDFLNSSGKPGYFQQMLKVYSRAGEKCTKCHTLLSQIKIAQRKTVFCPSCQK